MNKRAKTDQRRSRKTASSIRRKVVSHLVALEGKTIRSFAYDYRLCQDMLVVCFTDDTKLVIDIGARPALRAELWRSESGDDFHVQDFDVPLFAGGIEWKL